MKPRRKSTRRRSTRRNPTRRGDGTTRDKLTEAQVRTLNTVLDAGGFVYMHCGRLGGQPGHVNTRIVSTLVRGGLLEWGRGPTPIEDRSLRRERTAVFVTARGVFALRRRLLDAPTKDPMLQDVTDDD